MVSELFVDVQPKDISIAITEDKNLVEYQKENLEMTFGVGNIYLGRVKKLMPGLNACFVDIGSEKEAFLHYQDLGEQFASIQKYVKQVTSNRKKLYPFSKAQIVQNDNDGNISKVLEQGQEIIVQITKEPISTKGPRLTCDISYAGRFLVLVPFGDKVSVSSKIKSSQERDRLRQLIQSIKPKNCGVIIRTVAEGKRAQELDSELTALVKRWEQSIEEVHKSQKVPVIIHEETSRTIALLRDLLNSSYQAIVLNDKRTFQEVKQYVSLIAPEDTDLVQLYTSELPIFDHYAITKQIKSSFGRIVSCKGGAYLVIEHTEALHVVDVNSGHRMKADLDQEVNALEVNLGAADELARQLRLRDMGGIIVVDFIDMEVPEHRQQLYDRMIENMKRDRARHTILPLTKFGLMQITRQRVRPVMDVPVDETCPTCFGKGTVKPSILFTDQIENKIDTLVNKMDIGRFRLYIHPYVEAYVNKGLLSLKRNWYIKFGRTFKVIPDQSLPLLGYRFTNSKGEEIDMKEEHELI